MECVLLKQWEDYICMHVTKGVLQSPRDNEISRKGKKGLSNSVACLNFKCTHFIFFLALSVVPEGLSLNITEGLSLNLSCFSIATPKAIIFDFNGFIFTIAL